MAENINELKERETLRRLIKTIVNNLHLKAIVIYEAGGPEKLLYEEVPTPKVKEGWSLVRVQGFGINHSEIFTRKGQSPTVKFPRILGIECAGVIEETTDEKRLPVGTQVISIMGEMGRDFDGGYAEYALLPNQQIHPVHTDLPIEEWAALPEPVKWYSYTFALPHVCVPSRKM